mgnify:CR=1 FL=1
MLQLQSSMLLQLETEKKAKKEWVAVDMAKRMSDKGLKELFPVTAWPPSSAVRCCSA